MEQKTKKSNVIPLIIVAVIVIILAVVLLMPQFGKQKESVPIILERYSSISNGVVKYGDTAILESNGYIALNLMPGAYIVKYDLKQCSNPSLTYTKTFGGESMTYDPLKESVVVTADGKLQKTSLSESQKLSALLSEEVYVLETQGTRPDKHVPILYPDSFSFVANGQAKLLFRAKCNDASTNLKVYKS
ncbi:MAG: hypothetical protein AABY10_04790 [Nanoarchaeota archaeon]